MSKKKKKSAAEIEEQRKKSIRKTVIAVAAVMIAVTVIIIVTSFQERDQRLASVNADGDLVIPMSKVREDFHFFEYGGPQELLVWREAEGVYHTAFNTCEECYASGQARYIYQDGTLTCQACGNSMSVTGMGNDAWGGCQPVAIPEEYRNDSDTEIVIPGAVLQYSEDMFAMWDSGNFTTTLETYQP